MNLEDLKRPFPENEIKWRVGNTNVKKVRRETGNQNAKPTKGTLLAYIDARAAYDRLDAVCGDFWQCRYPTKGVCEIGVKIGSEWLWRANGVGETIIRDNAAEAEQEMKEKGNYSDAFKRAAVLWGVGRYLYHLPAEWVDLDEWGKPKNIPKLPNWALPDYVPQMDRKRKAEYVEGISEGLRLCDEHMVKELAGELTNEEKLFIWKEFNSAQRALIKEFTK